MTVDDAIALLLIKHSRYDITGCNCGWSELGRSHAKHVVQELRDAGFLRDACEMEPTNPHVYLSTGCLHGRHNYCQSMTGYQGEKRPGTCKFCDAQCTCVCHTVSSPLNSADNQNAAVKETQ